MTFDERYVPQYELAANEAFQLYFELSHLVSSTVRSELANAAFMLGRLTLAEQFADDALLVGHDYAIAYRIHLLRARCAFSKGELHKGEGCVADALRVVHNEPDMSLVEKALRCVRASLLCAEMHLALGRPQSARTAMDQAYGVLESLPETTAVAELRRQLDTLIVVASEQRDKEGPLQFAEYVAKIEGEWNEQDASAEREKSVLVKTPDGGSKILRVQAVEDVEEASTE
ncbi:MAG: hypothetical protein ACRCT8_11095 [Lacipirellulaceae bacterium]